MTDLLERLRMIGETCRLAADQIEQMGRLQRDLVALNSTLTAEIERLRSGWRDALLAAGVSPALTDLIIAKFTLEEVRHD